METTASRRDPLKNYQFRLKFISVTPATTRYMAGVTRVSGLSATVSAVEHWSGGNSLHRHAHPDRCQWDPITLEQGLALDDQLESWAEAAIDFAATGKPGLVKRGVILDVWDPRATLQLQQLSSGGEALPMYRFQIHNAWISRYEAMPALDGQGNEVALLSVELTHEGWQRVVVDAAQIENSLTPDNSPSDPGIIVPGGNSDTAIA